MQRAHAFQTNSTFSKSKANTGKIRKEEKKEKDLDEVPEDILKALLSMDDL